MLLLLELEPLDADGVAVAALLDAALNTVAPRIPPPSNEPAIMAAITPFRPYFIWITSLLALRIRRRQHQLRRGAFGCAEEDLGGEEESGYRPRLQVICTVSRQKSSTDRSPWTSKPSAGRRFHRRR